MHQGFQYCRPKFGNFTTQILQLRFATFSSESENCVTGELILLAALQIAKFKLAIPNLNTKSASLTLKRYHAASF